MTRHRAFAVDVRTVLRWWPLIALPAVIAVAAALWSISLQSPSYTAVTRLAVVPLAQWDETFLGTSMVRDGGDANATAATTAELLGSRQSAVVAAEAMGDRWPPDVVDDAVTVAAKPDTNIVEISVTAPDPTGARQLSESFARAVLADRWRTISAELDARIAAVSATTSADPNAGEASARLQTMTLIRQAGADPTVTILGTGPAVEQPMLPTAAVLALAALGGVGVGVLCVLAALRLRRTRPDTQSSEPAEPASVSAVQGRG